ncbi:uncharacterized protein LOC135682446 [Rhopilema esculentum]|uniref:uncharacterized protein LOC135682446 n=1 Tax=Rhopilema esculentum TaxID=499914 RepID=UPI0031D69256|eukprot:gene14262-5290_t
MKTLSGKSQYIVDVGDCETSPLLGRKKAERPETETEADRPSPKLCRSILTFLNLGMQTTAINATFAGLIAVLIWWLDLNLSSYCFGKSWDDIPVAFQRMRLTTEVVESFFIQFWSLSCLAPQISWSATKKMAIPYWNVIAASVDVIFRLFFFAYGFYGQGWQTIVGNIVFFGIMFLNHSKVAMQYLRNPKSKLDVFLMSSKLSTQFITGMVLSLLFNHIFLTMYHKTSESIKTFMCSLLPVIFAISKFITNIIIGNLAKYKCFEKGTMLVIGLQVSTTLVARMVQASNESFVGFVAISIVHGILNVFDKLALPIRNKITKFVLKRETTSSPVFLADQTLIGMVTETAAVILSCSSVYITMYYYMRDETSGQRYNGYELFYQALKRIGVAASIDFFFNTIAVKIQADLYHIPIMQEWKLHWKFIVITHMVQIIISMIYFSEYLDQVTMPVRFKALNNSCITPFSRL